MLHLLIELGKLKNRKGLVEEIIDIFEHQNAQFILNDWLAKKSVKLAKKGLVFDTISYFYDNTNSLYDRNSRIKQSRTIDENLVILGGSICSIESLQHNPRLFDSLRESNCKWVLCDFPPEGMVTQNEDYKPNIVYLRFDEEFENTFDEIGQFSEKIHWYPHCTITGFFNYRTAALKNCPELKVCLVSHVKPKHPDEIAEKIETFLNGEIETPIYLDHFSARVLIYYIYYLGAYIKKKVKDIILP